MSALGRETRPADPLAAIEGGLVVSCQAHDDEPLADPAHIAALAASAHLGGAVGLRVDDPRNVRACAQASDLPIIGIKKHRYPTGRPLITGTAEDARELAEAGAAIVAVDGSREYRGDDRAFADLLERIRLAVEVPVMVDVSTFDEGVRARDAGADVLATTLWGYTPETSGTSGPGIALATRLGGLGLPVVVEGRIMEPDELRAAFDAGAHAVVVGSAITNPVFLTRRFVSALPARTSGAIDG